MPLQQQQIPSLDPSEVEDAAPAQAPAINTPVQSAKPLSLDPGEVEDVTDVTHVTSSPAAPAVAVPQMNPAIAAQVQGARTNIAQYPENQPKPDPDYLTRKNAFEAVQGEPGAPQDFQYDPEQERLIQANQEVQNQHSMVPQAAVPALQSFQTHINDPLARMGQAGTEYLAHEAERSTADILHPSETFGAPNAAKEEQDIERLRKEHPAAAGISRAVGGTIGGVAADPRMWPLFFAGPETLPVLNHAMGTAFSVQMAKGAYDQAGELGAIMDNPNVPQDAKWEAGASAVLSAVMAGHAEGSKIYKQFLTLPPEDQAQIRQRVAQKRPDLAQAVQSPNGVQHAPEEPAQAPGGGMNAGPRPERFKPIVLDPNEVETAPASENTAQKGSIPQGNEPVVLNGVAAKNLGPDVTQYRKGAYQVVQLDSGDHVAFNPTKTNAEAVKAAAAKGELWKLTGQQAPAEARMQAERDLSGQEEPTSSKPTVNEESKDVKQDFTPELHPSEVEDVSNRFDKSETPREDADFRKRMEMSRVPEFRRELAQETDPAKRQQIQDAIDRETAFVRGQASPKEIPHENLPAPGEAEKHLKEGPRLASYRRTSDLEDDIHKSGMVYKGEVSPNSGVFQIEHPDHPGKTTTMKAAEITSPEAVKAKVEAHIKANSAAPSLEDIKRRLGVSNKVDNQEPGKTTKVVTHQDAADRLNAGDTEGTKAALRDLMAQKFGKKEGTNAIRESGTAEVGSHAGGNEGAGRSEQGNGVGRSQQGTKAAKAREPQLGGSAPLAKPKARFKITKADIVPTENGGYEARPHAAEKSAHEFASTQVNIREGTEAHQRHAEAAKALSDQHLAPEGRETKPHVTLRYGLKDDSPAAIDKLRSAIAGIKPFEITAGKTRAFPEGKDGVPLFSEVQQSKELNALRSAVQGAGDFKPDDHGEYKPHITLGYAKPGTEHRYVGMEGMSGAKVAVDHITVTTKDGQEVRIPLAKSADTISENGKPSGYGDKNTVFTAEKRDAALERLRKRRGQLNSGINPEDISDLIDIGGYHFEAGVRAFADWSKKMLSDVGEWAKPYLETVHEELTKHLTNGKISTASTGLSTEAEGKLGEKAEPRGAQGLIDEVYRKLQAGESLGNVTELNKLAEEHFGSTRTSGKWTPKDAFDAMEAGVNKYLLYHGGELMRMDTLDGLKELRELMPRLTSQSIRTDEQIKNQQFSTPPTEAYLAAKVAGLKPTDVVLEPSAGNGGLAVWAKAIGAKVHVNEISERRQKMLEAAGFGKATAHDGEIINSLLDPKIKPTVILMNPPFSASTLKSYEAKNRNQYGFNHVQSALQRLEDGGRLVAILGGGKANEPNGGASLTAQASGEWFQKIADKYNVRANIRINGKEYQKYGTNFATRLLVIDKDGPTPSRNETGKIKTWASVKQANVDTLEEAYNALKDVAESRPTRTDISGQDRPGQDNARAGVGADKDAGAKSDRGPAQGEPRGGNGAKSSDRPAQPLGSSGSDESKQGDQRVPVREPGDQSEKPAAADSTQNPEGSDKDVGVERPLAGTETSDAGLDLGRHDRQDKREQQDTSAYVKYTPTLKGAPHPADIVETKTMATVPLPEITYKPSLPKELIDQGGISAVQLEPVAMAGQQNDIVLPSGARSSVLIGDGTGVGKGRTGAAILMDNWRKGRKRLVWVSEKWDLMDAAQKDLEAIGAGDLAKKIKSFGKFGATQPIDHEGVLFSTYALIRSEDKKGNKRVHQLQNWLRGQDEGDGAYILWDEAHNLKNAVAATGAQESQIGVAAKKLMLDNPKLRSASMSATAATDVVNLGYLDRLGLWGPGTAFPGGFNQFASQIGSGGLSAMEMVARELKSQGKYIARNLSFKGVTYTETEHVLTPEQKEVYRSAVKAWKSVVQQAEKTIETTTNGGAYAKGRFMSLFYGAQLRFFNVLLTTLKIPTAVERAEKYLKDGKSVVITLVNTNEAAQNREKNKAKDAGDSDELPDYDFGPGEMLSDLVREHYPIQQFNDDVSSDGKPIKVPAYVKDEQGRDIPLVNPEAVKERDKLLADLKKNLQMPANPLDILINSLGGPKKVAELTGRKERYDESAGKFIMRGDPGVKRDAVNLNEMANFQGGKKDVAILSSAAGTGISLHAGKDVPNQKQRAHITLQIGWSADKQMQMFGRTHRTNQAHPPMYDTITSDLGGEKRFSSTLAKRMGSLGALSRGQTDAMSGADLMEKVNFESEQGKQATNTFYSQMLRNQPIPGTKLKGMQILEDLRVLKTTDGGGVTVPDQDRFNVTRLLNRMLALDPDHQNATYNYFYDIFQATVHDAMEAGKLDTGVKSLPGDEFKIKEERSLAKDPKTNAETFYYPVEASVRTERVSPEGLDKRLKSEAENNPRIVRNDKGELALVRDARPIVHASGATVPAVYISDPGNGKWQKIEKYQVDAKWKDIKDQSEATLKKARQDVADAKYTVDYQQKQIERFGNEPQAQYYHNALAKRQANLQEKEAALGQAEAAHSSPMTAARAAWAKQYEAAPTHTAQDHHLIGGAVMRYWNAIKEEAPGLKIYTTVDSKTGQRVVGIDVPGNRIGSLIKRISGGKATITASQIRQDVLKNGMPYDLEQGIQVKRGQISRRPVVTFSTTNADIQAHLKDLGVIHEKGVIPVYYLPDNQHGEHILENVLKEYPAKEPETNDDEETGIDRSGERGSATMSSMPIPALIEAVAKGVKKAGTLYHGAVDKLLEKTEMGKPRPEIRKYDPDAADLALKMDASGQYHKAVAEEITKRIIEPLSEDFLKTDTDAQRQAKNELMRDRMKGFHFMADEQNRHWLMEHHNADYHRWNSDPKITKALMEYAPFENDLRAAVKQLGGKTLDTDYIKRVMDFVTGGIAYEGEMPPDVAGPGKLVQGRAATGGAGRDNIVGPQVDRSKARTDAGVFYWKHGVFDLGPSLQKRWVEVMSKLDEHRLAVHAMSMGTRLQPGDEAPNMVHYNGKEFFKPEIAQEIIRIQKHGRSSESKELADLLGVSELPLPKDVHQYGFYEPLQGARFKNAARNLALRVLAEPDTAGMQGQAATVNRMAKLKYVVPEEIAHALNDANRETGQGRASKVLSKLLGPVTQFIRQQIVGLAYGVPHMGNIIRKVMQATPGSVLNPQAWANGVKVAFSKELKARGMSGVDDPTYKLLLRNAGISEGAIPEYKHYIEGNFDKENWKQTVANAFHRGGKEGARVTAGSALAGVGRLAIEPLNRFSEKGHNNLFKQGGIDQRARIWLADFMKDRRPGMSDADIAHEVNQTLGRYNRASWTDVQKGLAPYMLFPGWDYSSVTYAMKHPFKTTVAPAVLMLLANMVINSAGYNSNEDKHDPSKLHVGKYSVSSNLFNDNMGNHMFGWALRGAQGALDGKSTKETMGNMAKGTPSDVAGVSTSTLNPLISGVGSIAANRERLGSGQEIVNRGDIKKKGKVLPNKAAEDYAGFAGRRLFPLYDTATEADTGKMNPLSLGRLAGVSAYKKKPKK